MESITTNDGYQWKKLGPVSAVQQPSSVHDDEYDDGHAAGYAEGYREGGLKASKEHQAMLTTLQNTLTEVERLRERTLQDGLQDIAVALHMIFQQVFLYELRTAPELIGALIGEIRRTLQTDATPKLVLNRKDYNALSELAPAQLQSCLDVDDDLPEGVIRASAGKSMLELDVVANLEQVLANAVVSTQGESDEPQPAA